MVIMAVGLGDGIYMHCAGFRDEESDLDDQFVFRQGRSREFLSKGWRK